MLPVPTPTAAVPVLARPQTERAAPGHPYDPATGTGIEWQPGLARLWEGGRITERAAHATASPFDFWFWLQFASSFPQVTHWWFGSAWTGKVWVRACPPIPGGGSRAGGIQFGDRTTPEQPWQVRFDDPPRLVVPLPPLEDDPRNLPLRLALSQIVWEVHSCKTDGQRSALTLRLL